MTETGRDDLENEPFEDGKNSPKERVGVRVGGRPFTIEPRKSIRSGVGIDGQVRNAGALGGDTGLVSVLVWRRCFFLGEGCHGRKLFVRIGVGLGHVEHEEMAVVVTAVIMTR